MWKALERRNLGLGTPDAAALIVRLVRAWAQDMTSYGADPSNKDAQVILGIDLENAYGRALRSPCLAEAKEITPRIATLATAQWKESVLL